MSLSRFISLAVLLASTALVSCSPLPANTNTTPADIIPRDLGFNCGPQYYSLPEADDAFGDGIRLLRNGQTYAYARASGTCMSFLSPSAPTPGPHALPIFSATVQNHTQLSVRNQKLTRHSLLPSCVSQRRSRVSETRSRCLAMQRENAI